MELTRSGTTSFAEASFDAWSGMTLADLRIPDDAANRSLVQQRVVNNLTVTSNVTGAPFAAVTTGSGKTGFLEIWSYNYAPGTSGALASQPGGSGNGSVFDFDDTSAPNTNGHGSFQVHNITDRQTILAWNMHRNGGPAEIGFGNQPTGNPDWTFTSTYGNEVRSNTAQWKLQISVNTASPSLTINAGSGAVNISGATSNLSSLTVNNGSNPSAINGAISGTTSVTKAGTGTLTLSGENTYTGTTTINAGTLSVTGTLSDSTAVIVASGATYNVAANDTIASLTGAGNVNLNTSFILTTGDSNNTT
jgi:autotransporter-associated beta strand protein